VAVLLAVLVAGAVTAAEASIPRPERWPALLEEPAAGVLATPTLEDLVAELASPATALTPAAEASEGERFRLVEGLQLGLAARSEPRFRLYPRLETRVWAITLPEPVYIELALPLTASRFRLYGHPRAGIAVGGTFVTADPLGYTDGPSMYQGFGNSPLNYGDPLGLAVGDWWDPRSYWEGGFVGESIRELWNVASLGTLDRVLVQDNLGTWSGFGESVFNGARSVSNAASLGLQESIYETQMREGPSLRSVVTGTGRGIANLTPYSEAKALITVGDHLSASQKIELVFVGISKTAALGTIGVAGAEAAAARIVGDLEVAVAPGGWNPALYARGGGAIPAAVVPRGTTNPLQDTRYTGKVRQQMRPHQRTGVPDNHGFPLEVDNFAGQGTTRQITGRDGVVRTKVELPGSYRGKEGTFEWIVEPDGTVNHRLFVPESPG